MEWLHITKDRLREFRESVLRMSPEQISQIAGGIFKASDIEKTESYANQWTHLGYIKFLMEKGNMNGPWVISGQGGMLNSKNVSQTGANSLQQAKANSSINANCGTCNMANAFIKLADNLSEEKEKRMKILEQMYQIRTAEADMLMNQLKKETGTT